MTAADIYGKHYKNRHISQVAKRNSLRTRREGCSWVTIANGARAATRGAKHPSPDTVLALVPRSQETNPTTPGWSLPDMDLACARLGIGFEIHSGWDTLKDFRNQGYGIALAGSGDVFDVGCNSVFDGDHRIYIHPDESDGRWRFDNPLCTEATHRTEAKLREYAQHFADARTGGIISFGVFKPKVPLKHK